MERQREFEAVLSPDAEVMAEDGLPIPPVERGRVAVSA